MLDTTKHIAEKAVIFKLLPSIADPRTVKPISDNNRRQDEILIEVSTSAQENLKEGEMAKISPAGLLNLAVSDSATKILALTSLLLSAIICASPARAACTDWAQHLGRPNHRLIYAGTLGTQPIRLMLHLDQATGRFDGSYGYSSQLNALTLAGEMQAKDVGVDLEEKDEKGRITGHFSLKFYLPYQAGQYEKVDNYGCDALTGSWRPETGSNALPVSLRINGEADPSDDEERVVNETSAYKLRKAMLINDRKTFASLLRYPFISQNVMQVPRVWASPEEVIENYDKIVRFSPNQLEESVPHALQTSGSKSLFMDLSIELDDGKVSRICEAACAVSP